MLEIGDLHLEKPLQKPVSSSAFLGKNLITASQREFCYWLQQSKGFPSSSYELGLASHADSCECME